MKKIITKTIIALATISIGQVVFAQCSCCEPEAMAMENDYHNTADSGDHHATNALTLDQFNQIVSPYMSTQKALAGDDLTAVKKGGYAMLATIKDLSGDSKMVLMHAAQLVANASDISNAREAFLLISEVLISTVQNIQFPEDTKLYLAHCPMAFNNKGGSWLQDESVLANPYWGAMMLRCGTIKPVAGK